jgi:phosphatidate cytidylyltransferase
MVRRFLAAAAGVPAILGICWWGAAPFAVMMTVIAAVGAFEMVRAQRNVGLHPSIVLVALGLIGPALPLLVMPLDDGGYVSVQALLLFVGGMFLVALVREVTRAHISQRVTPASNVGSGLFGAGYISLFGGISMLRADVVTWGRAGIHGADIGFCMVLLALSTVWATDTAAYLVGRAVGSVPLSPVLSPRKTVEGAIAGFVAAVIVGAVLGHMLLGRAVLGWWIGAVAGVAGQIGDLFESGLKRELGIKDFGTIIPGHGGVLDRFDSLLFVAPAVWLLTRVVN